MKKKNLKEIPEFKTEDEEREFWGRSDSSDYLDWDKAEVVVFPNLKRTKSLLPENNANKTNKI